MLMQIFCLNKEEDMPQAATSKVWQDIPAFAVPVTDIWSSWGALHVQLGSTGPPTCQQMTAGWCDIGIPGTDYLSGPSLTKAHPFACGTVQHSHQARRSILQSCQLHLHV